MRELVEPKILQSVSLGLGDGENHCTRQCRILVTENGDGTFDPRIFFTARVGRSCERRFRRKTQVALCCDDALPKGDRTDVALPHCAQGHDDPLRPRSEEHTSELQSLMRISYAVFCLKKKNKR